MIWIRRLGLGVVVLAVILAGGIWLGLRASLPITTGTTTVAGIGAAVTITRDENGVPTIKAGSLADAYFALGYVHAQDRLFQMDLQRRLGAGRLSEIVGDRTLAIDRQMRTFGLYRAAGEALAVTSPEFRTVLDAYAKGVNAWIAHGGVLQPEFYVLGYRPQPWTAQDSMVFGKLLALELSGNFRRELLRARVAAKLPPDKVRQLFPEYPKDGPVALRDLASLYRMLPVERMLAALPPLVGPTPASNNWVVDGAHSATGKPLLANDPHLDYSAPGIWYLARIEAPGLTLVGGTIAGAPLVVLGHNQRIAWGYTTTNGDVEDLFIEKLDPADPGRYLTPQGSEPFTTRQETIKIKGAADQILTIRTTRHGPVISDAVADTAKLPPNPDGAATVVALATNFLDGDDRSEEAQWRLNQAGNWDEFTAALKLFAAPEQNMVYADIDGNIGFYAPAHLPIRKAGDGSVPVPGWTGDYDWTGWVPFDALPHEFNPKSGRIATANNKIVPDDYPYLITRDWDLPFRAQRIEQRLSDDKKETVAGSTSIMRDDVSITAERLLPLMLAVEPSGDQQAKAHDILKKWDFTMAADRPEPLIFTAWLRALNRRIYADELGELFPAFLDANPLFVESVLTQNQEWCDDVTTPQVESCAMQVSAALDEALGELRRSYGSDMDSWRWGEPHQAFFAHPIFRAIPILNRLYDRSIAANGGRDTVDAGAFHDDGHTDMPYLDVHGAGLRTIYDLSDLERSVFMIAPGQSGHPLSPHYDDLLRPWRNFEWLRLPHDPKGDVLTLAPAP